MRFVIALICACLALTLVAINAHANPSWSLPKCSKACKERVKKRVLREREKREWARYRANPMPYCTWGPESGEGRPEWSLRRYRQPNVSGGSGGGKFQILDSTWAGFGGLRYAAHAHWAKPLHQERVARRVLAGQGLGAWVNC